MSRFVSDGGLAFDAEHNNVLISVEREEITISCKLLNDVMGYEYMYGVYVRSDPTKRIIIRNGDFWIAVGKYINDMDRNLYSLTDDDLLMIHKKITDTSVMYHNMMNTLNDAFTKSNMKNATNFTYE